MDYQLGSEQLGYHSEILEYLEQAQEEAQRQSLKSKGNISSFRLEKGARPLGRRSLQSHRPSSGEQCKPCIDQSIPMSYMMLDVCTAS